MNTKSVTPVHINAITPGAADLTFPCDALLVSAAGSVTVLSVGGDTATFNVVAGQTVSLACKRVTAATATLFALGY